MFQIIGFICSYIDDLLILPKVDLKYHVQKFVLTLNKLKERGLKCDIENVFFGKTKMEYLGLGVTCARVITIDLINN